MNPVKLSSLLVLAVACFGFFAGAKPVDSPAITLIRVPAGGIQPQAVVRDGVLHLIYFAGDPAKGDIFYVSSRDFGRSFSAPIRVNSLAGSAIAIGNIRGAQLAVGRNGRVHVAWNGSSATAAPAEGNTPMLYTRLDDASMAFEPERNLIHSTHFLDGGGTVAADARGDVYVFWQAPAKGQTGEENRRVWVAKSTDDGKTFAPETAAFKNPTGACACCGMRAATDGEGNIYVLYRSATAIVNRDMWLLTSADRGRSFDGRDISKWKIGACVMSAESLSPSPEGMLAAWETEKQVYFARVNPGGEVIAGPFAAPGAPVNRKYPVAVANNRGEILFVWTEGTAWKRGGQIEWQLYDHEGRAEGPAGRVDGFPAWSLVTAFARPDGSFAIVY